jgi:GT2 family glycosyltransferase
MLNTIMISAIVCIPSFKRPFGLQKTLTSLVEQQGVANFAVVVVDNDRILCEATPIANKFFEQGLLQGEVIAESAQGNVKAINAVFSYALQKYPQANVFLMMDDDEVASPFWLREMLEGQAHSKADIIGGPVNPVFEDAQTPFAQHPLFWSAFKQTGFIERLYGSGNCLITRQVFERLGDKPFDEAFNHLGGGDADFFIRASQEGFKTYFNAQATIEEIVPRERTTKQWLIKRCLRVGALNVLIEQKRMSKFRSLLKNFAWFFVALQRALKDYKTYKNVFIASQHFYIALGRFLPFFNMLPKPYGI